VLARGGTAVDGAIAAAFAAAVTESPLTGPGAGGFLMARPAGQSATLLDFFVAVPGTGDEGRPLQADDLEAFTVPFGDADQVFYIGPASVAVPGMIQGLVEAHERFGVLPLADLVAPAVQLARDGVVLSPEAGYLHTILTDMLTHSPEARAVYAPKGRLLVAGDTVRFPELADVLLEIGRTGRHAMSADGWLAGRLRDDITPRGGLITRDDLAAYRVIERTPLSIGFRDLEILTNPPPSAGGVLIAAALRHLEGSTPATDENGHYRAVAAAGVAANAHRTADFAELLHGDGFLEQFLAALGDTPEPGAGPGETRKPAGSTTHVSVVDANGGMASLSSSNGAGSGVMAAGTGFLLNNMLGEEDLNPGGFGRIPPGRRMTSMMAPTLLLRGGEPVIAVGSAGSNRLRSAIVQTIASLVDQGLSIPDSVHRPRVHPEGDGLDVEGGISQAVCGALEADGHSLRRWGDMNLFFGGVSAAGRSGQGLDGAGDPRRAGGAFGVTRAGEVVELTR
jgi:gamma-glutamyltranspeptidase / glutathione hydrolase